ncbi:uncharacterized protein [Parasteatoda tepidariorum]|uniref:uncharacterized protein n=1 Tax=Parasteatoda tepidariorum TaxID=114398 RepID=UPI001C71FAA1|nr:uncharacterized protein LOC107455961 [Parasteatoda tepidariorum]
MAANKTKSIPEKNEENTFIDSTDGIITSKQDESLVLMAAPSRKRFLRDTESEVLPQVSTNSQVQGQTDRTDMATKEEEMNKDLEKRTEKVSGDSDGVIKAEQLQPRLLKAAPSRKRFGMPEQKPKSELPQADNDQKKSAHERP